MTGNSLDAADVVLTAFYQSGKIEDLEFFSLPSTKELFNKLKDLRNYITNNDGNMNLVAKSYKYNSLEFNDVLNEYMDFIAAAVEALVSKAKNNSAINSKYNLDKIDIIGFHGQTCAHKPPSQAKENENIYTVQIGDGQKLADITGITVAYDFRSDDIMAGGEGAPFAPMHNFHCAKSIGDDKYLPITFINGGNTSNISNISYNKKGREVISGWDAGAFNHFPDLLARKYTNKICDFNGAIGRQGKINIDLLKILFETGVINSSGESFLLKPPPKSSDPQWYKNIIMLDDKAISLEDKMRTAEYFASYLTYHSLAYTAEDIIMPHRFTLFGGGWKNPLIKEFFTGFINGEFDKYPIIDEHLDWFKNIDKRIKSSGEKAEVKFSDEYGFSSEAMEARIFADMACCRITNKAFTSLDITGVKKAPLCGILAYPNHNLGNVTDNLKRWLDYYKTSKNKTAINYDERWSRAAAGF